MNGIPQMIVLQNMGAMNTASVRKELGKRLKVGLEIPLRWLNNKTKRTLQGLADEIWTEYFYDSNYDSNYNYNLLKFILLFIIYYLLFILFNNSFKSREEVIIIKYLTFFFFNKR